MHEICMQGKTWIFDIGIVLVKVENKNILT